MATPELMTGPLSKGCSRQQALGGTSLLTVIIIGLIVGVFLMDLWLPPGLAIPVLYAIPVLLTVWRARGRSTLLVAGVSTILTGLGFLLSPQSEGSVSLALFNRAISLFGIWATAMVTLLHRRTRGMLEAREELQAVAALQDSETRLRLLFEQIPAVLWTTDAELRFNFARGAGLSAFGLQTGELAGASLENFFPERSTAAPVHAHRQALAGRSSDYQVTFGERIFQAYVEPLRTQAGQITGCIGVAIDITERARAEEEVERLLMQLQDALAKVKILRGLLPICSACKKIRDDKGYWSQIEQYIREHADVQFSHGICPDCRRKLYPDLEW